jgi:ATP-dependent Clp protease ATP-binding subunit ClpA
LTITPEAIQHVCEEDYDAPNGARPLARTIDRIIIDPLPDRILAGRIKAGDTINIGYTDLPAIDL